MDAAGRSRDFPKSKTILHIHRSSQSSMTQLLPINRALMSSAWARLPCHALADDLVVVSHRCQDLREADEALDLRQEKNRDGLSS